MPAFTAVVAARRTLARWHAADRPPAPRVTRPAVGGNRPGPSERGLAVHAPVSGTDRTDDRPADPVRLSDGMGLR